jgi:hypothetical protein
MSRGASAEKQWRERFRRFARSELSVVEFCRREGVSTPSFYHWRRKLAESSSNGPARPSLSRASFVPVQVSAEANLQVSFPNGARLTFPASDHELIRVSIETIARARTGQGDA